MPLRVIRCKSLSGRAKGWARERFADTSETPSSTNKRDTLADVSFVGGGRWIRTIEGIASRFTVCPLWPLGNSSVFNCVLLSKWSWWTDLNPRPADYKSAALPAELHQQMTGPSVHRPCHLKALYYNTKCRGFCQPFFKKFFIFFRGERLKRCRSRICLGSREGCRRQKAYPPFHPASGCT